MFICCFFLLVSCKDSEDTGCFNCDTAPMVAKSDLEYMGWTVPFSIQEMEDDLPIYILGLMPHARPFSFNESVLNSALYDEMPDGRKIRDLYGSKFLKLLKESEEKDIPVRVYIYPNTSEIWWVEEATAEEIKKYEEAKIPPANVN